MVRQGAFVVARTVLFAFLTALLCGNVDALPLTCKTLNARLTITLMRDIDLNPTPEIKWYGDTDLINIFLFRQGENESDGYIWCMKADETIAEISLDFQKLELMLPSRLQRAKALVADVVCTLVKAEMEVCDELFESLTQNTLKYGDSRVELALGNWKVRTRLDDVTFRFVFNPGPNTTIDRVPMKLGP